MTYKQWLAAMPRSQAEIASYKKRILRKNLIGTAMAIAPFLGFIFFTLFPMAMSLGISFTELHSYDLSLSQFIGISNYTNLFQDELFWKSIVNTLTYCLSVPINLFVAVFLANLVNKLSHGQKIWMAVLFIPQVCSGAAAALMWKWIFQEDYGIVNIFLTSIGLGQFQPMNNPGHFMPAILIMSCWQYGTNIVVLAAAFSSINKSLQEAARLDGAGEMRVFWSVTFPQLTPTIFYLLTMNLITALQEQAVFQLITTNGVGPDYKALTMVYYIYRMGFSYTQSMGLGMACAMSWITALFILLVTRINFWLSKKWVSYD